MNEAPPVTRRKLKKKRRLQKNGKKRLSYRLRKRLYYHLPVKFKRYQR